MIYTKPWEYRLGMTMMFFSSAAVIFMVVLAILHFVQGDMIALMYTTLGAFNAYYVGKFYQETKDYRERRGINA